MAVCVKVGSAQTVMRGATLRYKLQTKLVVSSIRSILTLGPVVLALNPERPASLRAST